MNQRIALELQSRSKWHKKCNELKVGDLVLLVEKDTPRGKWPKGLIEEIIPGKERIVRQVSLRTAIGVFRRHLGHLCFLVGQLD